ncbi:restriction endonuclease subunit S [Aeromonas jandaei]|uniref:restriction endonuclease subunit S n=1 Tax=Aeromonas jandaei TaxID=650 RepID=UPI00111661C1|nr:restriction endonuclease subunit S [Aeromonas jandaei]TNI06395.1 restriction endonuclease subunit S [Aeromonas jandaei]
MAKQMMQDKASEMAATQTVPTGYKQTEVGVIPEDWDIKELQQICRVPITYGMVQCGPHIVNGIPYIRVSDMTARELDIDGMQRTSPQIAAAFARSTVDEGDIVYALRGKLGFVRSVPSSVAGANLTQGTARISPVPNVFGRYVFWALQSPRSLEQATQGAKGSTFVEITLASLKEIKIPVPRHKEEQKVIANALSDIDELIAGLEQLIAKKQAIKTATMQQLLTGRTRLQQFALRPDGTPKGYKSSELGQIPEDWDATTLGDISEVCMCKRIFSGQTVEVGEIPFYKIGTFGGEPDAYISVSLYKKFRDKYSFPEKGDILISAAGTLGKTVIYDGCSAYFQDSNIVWLKIDKSKICNEYLYHAYKLIRWASPEGSTISRLYNGIIRATMIVIPTLLEQTAIATIFSDMDSELTALEQKLAKARDVKQGMMQQLLTGRIRLPLEEQA